MFTPENRRFFYKSVNQAKPIRIAEEKVSVEPFKVFVSKCALIGNGAKAEAVIGMADRNAYGSRTVKAFRLRFAPNGCCHEKRFVNP